MQTFHVDRPRADAQARRRSTQLLGDVGTFHRGHQPERCCHNLTGDLFLLDGDHNWYTVLHELRAIERCAERYERAFPVVCLHDIGWPYGRRDLYYAPERIPTEFRQPYAQKGLDVDKPDLLDAGGFNLKHYNAFHEGGPRNGVLTAVEQFVEESKGRFELLTIPASTAWASSTRRRHSTPRCARAGRTDPHPRALRGVHRRARARAAALLAMVHETHWALGGHPGPGVAKLVRLGRRIKRFGRNEDA